MPVVEARRIALGRAAVVAALTCSMFTVVASHQTSAASSGYVSLAAPQRVLDTRAGAQTADGEQAGGGLVAAGGVVRVALAGRVGLPDVGSGGAVAVSLNVTVTEGEAPGFVTVYPCGLRPTASSLNYVAGQTVPNAVIATLSATGDVCLYTLAAAHLIVDASGWFPDGTYDPLDSPQRLFDSRPGSSTADGAQAGTGRLGAGQTVEVDVAGRVGLGASPASVVLNVAVTETGAPGFVTVFPCGVQRPTASNVNYLAGQTVPNQVIAKVGAGGRVCIYTLAATHLLVDVSGSLPADSFTPLGSPQRVVDTRPDGGGTADGKDAGDGAQPGRTTLELQLGDRVGVPQDASAVVLNVTAVTPLAPGFVTAHPRGSSRPTASNVNYLPGQFVANSVVARLGVGGQVCLFSLATTHLVVDVAGFLTGPPPSGSGGHCPAADALTPNAHPSLINYGNTFMFDYDPNRWTGGAVDRIAVLACDLPGNVNDQGAAEVAAWANAEVAPWFAEASRGQYTQQFEPHPLGRIERQNPDECFIDPRALTGDPFTNVMTYMRDLAGSTGRATPGVLSYGPPSATGRSGRVLVGSVQQWIHEIGHTLNWPHSYIDPTWQYSNPVDIMSGGRNVENTLAINRLAVGWVRDDQVALHPSGHAFYALDRPAGNGLQLVMLPDPSQPWWSMTLEARPAAGRDAAIQESGVAIHVVDQLSGGGTFRRQGQALGDDFSTYSYQHVIAVGESVAMRGVTVRVVEAAGDGYLVQVIGTYHAAGSLLTF